MIFLYGLLLLVILCSFICILQQTSCVETQANTVTDGLEGSVSGSTQGNCAVKRKPCVETQAHAVTNGPGGSVPDSTQWKYAVRRKNLIESFTK
jgi:hypothetical protein